MEDITGREEVVELVFQTPTEQEIRSLMQEMDMLPSVRNQFLPDIIRLADQPTTGNHLTVDLLDAIDKYAKSRAPGRQDTAVKRMVEALPGYLNVFISDAEILAATQARLEHILSKPEIGEWLGQFEASTSQPNLDDQEDNEQSGAPRGIKAILKIPPENRTDEQVRKLDKWYRQLGSAASHNRKKRKSPSQRELSKMQAKKRQV